MVQATVEPVPGLDPGDNACVESFFGLLKRERINRVRYRTRDQARADVFDYIEVFYNRKRRHGYLGNVSPADFEKQSAGSFGTVHRNGPKPIVGPSAGLRAASGKQR